MSCPRYRHRFYSPLRSLSRVASDYSSDSAVCFGILRPLRPLREIKDKSDFVFHAKSAKSAEFLFPFLFHACAGGVTNFVATRVRRVLSTPSSLRGTRPCLRGRVSYNRKPALTNCPSETGGRARSAEGVDSSRFCFSLRSLSRVASDYSSDSVVCFGNSASFASFA